MEHLIGCLVCAKDTFSQMQMIALAVMIFGSIISLICWLVILSHLIALNPQKRNPYKYLIWSIYLPYLNLLWVPWALISANGIVKKVQDSYGNRSSLSSASAVQIMAIPSLVLYLFWAVIFLMMFQNNCRGAGSFDLAKYSSVVVICVLLVFSCYLIYLASFVHKITELLKINSKASETGSCL